MFRLKFLRISLFYYIYIYISLIMAATSFLFIIPKDKVFVKPYILFRYAKYP